MQETVIITGGTGLVGRALSKKLQQEGYRVVILSRRPSSGTGLAAWDPEKQTIDENAIAQAHVIVNLAGAGVMEKSWTPAYRKTILESRVNSGSLIYQALQKIPNQVHTVINASAIGWYPDSGSETTGYTEDHPPADSFLGATCKAWEESIKPVSQLGKRLVIYRIGIVLSPEGGALKEFVKTFRFRLAAYMGNGRQVVSWIHIDDLCRMIQFAMEQKSVNGIYNAVAPEPVSNKSLIKVLSEILFAKKSLLVSVPAFIVKMMLGARSIEVLKSTRVSSDRIQNEGFHFNYPNISVAAKALL